MSEQRKNYLRFLLSESVRLIREQGEMPAPVSAVPPAAPPAPDLGMAPQPGADASQDSSPEPFTVDEMIERLNVIRSGKSFSDPEVYGQLTTYFRGLSDADKAVIDRFLQGLGKVVIQVDTAQQSGTQGGAPPPPPLPAAQPPPSAPSPAAPVGPME